MGDAGITLLVAVVASLPGVLAYVGQIRKSRAQAADHNAEAAESVSQAWQVLLIPYQQRVAELARSDAEKGKRLEALELYVAYLWSVINQMSGRLALVGESVERPLSLEQFQARMEGGRGVG